MRPDIDIKYYYGKFIEDANKAYDINKEDYNNLISLRKRLYRLVANKKAIINEFFNLDINNIGDDNEINAVDFNACRAKTRTSEFVTTDVHKRLTYLNFLKYLQVQKNVYGVTQSLKLEERKKRLTITEYRKLVQRFYNYGVMKCILEGYAYQVAGGLGNIVCNRWKVTSKKPVIDFNATNKKKREILAAGKKLYNEDEAAACKLRGIKYDGVPYKVYKTNDYYYEFKLIDNSRYKNVNIKFERKDRIDFKYRGMSQEEIAAMCKTADDIYHTKFDMRFKLGILLAFEPMSYLNFIRNAEQKEYSLGAHNSQNRQRFQS